MGILSIFGSVFSFLSGVAPAISGYFQTKANVEATEFQAMTDAERAEYVAYVGAQAALNQAKVSNNHTLAAQIMIYLFGLPPAIHWGMVFITSAIEPWYPIAIHSVAPAMADAEKQIALSFFILAPALPVVNALSARLRG